METLVPPLNHYLDGLTANYLNRTRGSAVSKEIQEACDTITSRLRRRRRGRPRGPADPTPRQALDLWADRWRTEGEALPPVGSPDGSTEIKKKLKANTIALWRKWNAYIKALLNRRYYCTPLELDLFGLSIHDDLQKAESSVVVQLRTGVNGLGDTLSRLRVPGATERCRCGTGKETTAHFLLWCPEQEPRRQELRNLFQGRPLSIRRLLGSDMVRKTCKWVIMSGRFAQFTLAGSLLYN